MLQGQRASRLSKWIQSGQDLRKQANIPDPEKIRFLVNLRYGDVWRAYAGLWLLNFLFMK